MAAMTSAEPIIPNVNRFSRSELPLSPDDLLPWDPWPPPKLDLNSKTLSDRLGLFASRAVSDDESDGSDLLELSLSTFGGGFELRSPKNLPNPFGGFSPNSVQYLFNNNCTLVYVCAGACVCDLL